MPRDPAAPELLRFPQVLRAAMHTKVRISCKPLMMML